MAVVERIAAGVRRYQERLVPVTVE
jgi:hypothetical protein